MKKLMLFRIFALAVTISSANFNDLRPKYIKALDSTEFETTTYAVGDPTLRGLIPADLSFMIADIKYKENDLKIIEFGDGLFAGFKVLDHMYSEGKVWKALWDNLNHYQLPTWYVGEYQSVTSKVAWRHFILKGGNYAPTLSALNQNIKFKQAQQKKIPFDPTDLTTYKGIIVIKRYNLTADEFNKFKNNHPDFIILCEATTKAAGDKNLTNLLFNTERLKQFRPKCAVYPREYSSDLAEKISKDLNCKWFFIKPIFSGRGNGILTVKKAQLDATLKQILHAYHNHLPYDNHHDFRPNNPLAHEYWRYERNSHFLVEEYVESKEITVFDKPYDPTMRVVFMLAHSKGQAHLTFLDAYWKRPIRPLNSKGTFREKHISKHAPNYYESIGGEVAQNDLEGVEQLMKECLPEVYWNMLVAHYQEKQQK